MSADRLRTAADQLDETVRYAGDNPGMASWAAQNAATAAVLRAVADSHEDYGYSGPYCAALALADAILGAES